MVAQCCFRRSSTCISDLARQTGRAAGVPLHLETKQFSTCCCSSLSPWPALGFWRSSSMIVVEKTRDIGILKSLRRLGPWHHEHFSHLRVHVWAPSVRSRCRAGAWVLLIRAPTSTRSPIWLAAASAAGSRCSTQQIYYLLHKIPVIVSPLTVAWIVGGRGWRLRWLASVLPALRAARIATSGGGPAL